MISVNSMRASWLEAVAGGEAEGFSRHYMPDILDEVERLRLRLEAAERAKNWAYSERNNLVAAMSKIFPSWLEDHDATDTAWENDWRNIVFINLPTGQASWHLHDSELPMFGHLLRLCGNSWDGHTNDEKYARLAALAALDQEKPR